MFTSSFAIIMMIQITAPPQQLSSATPLCRPSHVPLVRSTVSIERPPPPLPRCLRYAIIIITEEVVVVVHSLSKTSGGDCYNKSRGNNLKRRRRSGRRPCAGNSFTLALWLNTARHFENFC